MEIIDSLTEKEMELFLEAIYELKALKKLRKKRKDLCPYILDDEFIKETLKRIENKVILSS